MMSDREKKVLCFGVAIGILLGVIAIKTVGTRGAVIFAALAFLIPLVPELRVRARKSRLPQVPSIEKPHLEASYVTMPHIETPHIEKPHVELPEVDLSSDWLSNKAIVIYFMIFIISFVIGYVVLN